MVTKMKIEGQAGGGAGRMWTQVDTWKSNFATGAKSKWPVALRHLQPATPQPKTKSIRANSQQLKSNLEINV
jgi:hypothetical protein